MVQSLLFRSRQGCNWQLKCTHISMQAVGTLLHNAWQVCCYECLRQVPPVWCMQEMSGGSERFREGGPGTGSLCVFPPSRLLGDMTVGPCCDDWPSLDAGASWDLRRSLLRKARRLWKREPSCSLRDMRLSCFSAGCWSGMSQRCSAHDLLCLPIYKLSQFSPCMSYMQPFSIQSSPT